MRKAVLMMLLTVVSSSAAAAWVEVGSDETTTFYADPATIRTEGNMVKMWHLLDFKAVTVPPGGKRYMYLSSKSKAEYDCKEERARVLSFAWYSGNMGEGKAVYSTSKPGPWEPVAPESAIELLWNIACGKIVTVRR